MNFESGNGKQVETKYWNPGRGRKNYRNVLLLRLSLPEMEEIKDTSLKI